MYPPQCVGAVAAHLSLPTVIAERRCGFKTEAVSYSWVRRLAMLASGDRPAAIRTETPMAARKHGDGEAIHLLRGRGGVAGRGKHPAPVGVARAGAVPPAR